jgi:UDP-N-acetylglucosamine diphosphorylase/glucosamine-1-phosphate N-acetyltransferase
MEGFSFPILVVALINLKSYHLHLEESHLKLDFYPLTLNRNFSDLRIGLFSIQERWKLLANQQHINLHFTSKENAQLSISANCIPSLQLSIESFFANPNANFNDCIIINRIWELTSTNIQVLLNDLILINADNYLFEIPDTVKLTGNHPIYIHPTAILDHCFINTENGPVLIDEHAQIMAGAMLRGPIYIGKQSVVKMGAMLYEGSNIGNNCVVGGEIKNSIFHANANKAHHGYIGDSYIGEWCNLGAGTTCSNLKNTAGKIKIWDMQNNAYRLANEKAGVFMGDFVRTAVNTTINSGSVIGAFANVFNKMSLTPKYIAPFSWSQDGQHRYDIEKLMTELEKWMSMKGQTPTDDVKTTIINLYNQFKQ